MKPNDLTPAPGSTRERKRVGRGPGSGHGKTSGRGHKGQKARSGGKTEIRVGFEGGQMPLQRRLPKRGFTNIFRTNWAEINLTDLSRYAAGTDVTPAVLVRDGVISSARDGLVVLGKGELNVPLRVSGHRFSKRAKEAIEAAGGTASVIS
ncbi:MAG: 50S ribosomal protein L15 [Candidatus Schekmanbacteria bacterium]|nr:50S ribosomal protein L15 [Candidatus Schekmanbacteria bacterium]